LPPKSSIFSARAINQISEHSKVSPSQDFFAAFGDDGIGIIGTPTTINSGDMAGILMIAVQALEKQNRDLKERVETLERLIKERPYLTASSVPVLSKVEGPVQ